MGNRSYLSNTQKKEHTASKTMRGGLRRGVTSRSRQGGAELFGQATTSRFQPPECRRPPPWTSLRKNERIKSYLNRLVESKTRTSHGRGGAAGRGGPRWDRRDAGGVGRFGQRATSRFQPAEHRRQPSWTFVRKHDQTKSHANRIEEHDDRLTSGLSAGPDALFAPGC